MDEEMEGSVKEDTQLDRTYSRIWSYYDSVDKVYSRCSVCSKLVRHSGNTTSLHRHLRQHPDAYKAMMEKREEEEQDEEPASVEEELRGTEEEEQRRSGVWRYFKAMDKRHERCDVCKEIVRHRGKAHALHRHLRTHPEVYSAMRERPEEQEVGTGEEQGVDEVKKEAQRRSTRRKTRSSEDQKVVMAARGELVGGVSHTQCLNCGAFCRSHAHHLSHLATTHPLELDRTHAGRLGLAFIYQETGKLFHCNICLFTSRDFTQVWQHLLRTHCIDQDQDLGTKFGLKQTTETKAEQNHGNETKLRLSQGQDHETETGPNQEPETGLRLNQNLATKPEAGDVDSKPVEKREREVDDVGTEALKAMEIDDQVDRRKSSSPADPGPSPAYQHPTLAKPGPSPANQHPTLAKPGPSLADQHPTLAKPGPSPADPGPSLADQHPTLAKPGPSPADPGPSPADPGPSPADPGPSPADPGPSPADPTLSTVGHSRADPDPSPPGPGPTSGIPGLSSADPGPSPAGRVSSPDTPPSSLGLLLIEPGGYRCSLCSWFHILRAVAVNHVVRKHQSPRPLYDTPTADTSLVTETNPAPTEEEEEVTSETMRQELEASKILRFTGHFVFCEICGWKTKLKRGTRGFAQSHLERCHDLKKEFECSICGQAFFMSYRLKEHIRVHHKPGKYRCLFCSFRSDNLTGFRRHSAKCNYKELDEDQDYDQNQTRTRIRTRPDLEEETDRIHRPKRRRSRLILEEEEEDD